MNKERTTERNTTMNKEIVKYRKKEYRTRKHKYIRKRTKNLKRTHKEIQTDRHTDIKLEHVTQTRQNIKYMRERNT